MVKICSVLISIFFQYVLPIKPDSRIWIFSSVNNEKFNYNSKYLFEYVIQHFPEVQARFVINHDETRKALQKKYGESYFIESKSVSGIRKVMEGGVWLTSAGLPVYGFFLNRNRRIVNLWHGVPLKRIALMENNVSLFERLFLKMFVTSNYSDVLTTSHSLISIMANSFNVNEKIIKVWGQPRNDMLYEHVTREMVLDRVGIKKPVKKVILYAPTYREFGSTILFPFNDFEMEKFCSYLEKNQYLMLVRHHLSERKQELIFGQYLIYANEDLFEDITEILPAVDCVITDYSSLYIDYLLLNKPVLFLPYDKEEYCEKRGFNFNYDDVTPGPKPKSMSEMMYEISYLLSDPSYYGYQRNLINDFFNEIKGPCRKQICEKLLNGDEQ